MGSPWLSALTRSLRRTGSPLRRRTLRDDENVVAAPHDVEFLQTQPPVADAFAGPELELVAVPRADEMHLVGEGLPLIGAIGGDHVDHAVDHDALAGRSAGMDAVVAVSEIGAVLVEHADLRVSGDDDAPVAVLHLGRLGNEAFGHGSLPRRYLRAKLLPGTMPRTSGGHNGDHPMPGIRSRPALNSMLEPAKSSPTGSKRPPRCCARKASTTAVNERRFSGRRNP